MDLEARGSQLAELFRAGGVPTNRQFDVLYPVAVRTMSASYWTPVRVALQAARMLVTAPGTRVLDIGSGAGKFCCVGASSTTGVFCGVEQRAQLVQYARNVAALLGAGRATFLQGTFGSLSPSDYDAFYLFNPFEENEDRSLAAGDRTAVPGDDWFLDDVRRAQSFLGAARPGTRVVTYNGLGGPMPAAYELLERVRFKRPLDLWVKRA